MPEPNGYELITSPHLYEANPWLHEPIIRVTSAKQHFGAATVDRGPPQWCLLSRYSCAGRHTTTADIKRLCPLRSNAVVGLMILCTSCRG
mmetsp:Transcript_63742/g.151961  ORF Transcript_63742/g.151961 Transcript_63742/m.151961 type:complete len:90 (+) Transcript_63742:1186-1455(+)